MSNKSNFTIMRILCLGLSHHTAPIKLRERLDYPIAALQAALARFAHDKVTQPGGISELAILSTCNRVELYAAVPDVGLSDDDAFAYLQAFIAETREMPAGQFAPHLYRHVDAVAAEHLYRVAAGLESMVLGEPQILGQVTDAHAIALTHAAVGPVIGALFRAAIRSGKRARTETSISRNPASIGSVAVRLAQQVVGQLDQAQVLIVGAGEMAELTVKALRARGVRQIVIANRTHQRALVLAERWGGRAHSFEQLPRAIAAADIVIASTGAPHTIIDSAIVNRAMAGRDARPLALIDIAVPRDIAPGVGDISGVHVFNIDDLQSRLQAGLTERQREIPQVEAIIAEEIAAFEALLRGLEMQPLIVELRHKAEAIRQYELERILRNLPDLDPETREQIQHLSRSLVNKLLHEPTRRLRIEANNGHGAEYVDTVRRLFGLDSGTQLE